MTTPLQAMEDYGPIVYANHEMGCFITINGSYLNWWNTDGEHCSNSDCRSFAHTKLPELTWVQAMDKAEAWADEVFKEGDEE